MFLKEPLFWPTVHTLTLSSLSKTATFLADGLYIDFCLNLSTKATSLNNIGQPQYYK